MSFEFWSEDCGRQIFIFQVCWECVPCSRTRDRKPTRAESLSECSRYDEVTTSRRSMRLQGTTVWYKRVSCHITSRVVCVFQGRVHQYWFQHVLIDQAFPHIPLVSGKMPWNHDTVFWNSVLPSMENRPPNSELEGITSGVAILARYSASITGNNCFSEFRNMFPTWRGLWFASRISYFQNRDSNLNQFSKLKIQEKITEALFRMLDARLFMKFEQER